MGVVHARKFRGAIGLDTLLRLAESRSGSFHFSSLRKASFGFFWPSLACFGTDSVRMQTPAPFFKNQQGVETFGDWAFRAIDQLAVELLNHWLSSRRAGLEKFKTLVENE